jgi:pimeloyl-ACP methyl ester carboxylesterase
MPAIARAGIPWLRIDPRRVYAFGGSMGGQESLLLLARHPHLLAGVAAFDAVSDFAQQYRSFGRLRCNARCLRDLGEPLGRRLQLLARSELGGTPWQRPLAFAERSPITYTRGIAASCVPLQIWWSPADRVVVDQQRQSGKFFWRLRAANPRAPVSGYVGFWIHSHEMRASTRLPFALRQFGLLPPSTASGREGLHVVPAPARSCAP